MVTYDLLNWLILIMPLSTSGLKMSWVYSITGTLLADTKYELADPCNTTIDVWTNCAISLGREELGTCSTLTGLLRVKLCRVRVWVV